MSLFYISPEPIACCFVNTCSIKSSEPGYTFTSSLKSSAINLVNFNLCYLTLPQDSNSDFTTGGFRGIYHFNMISAPYLSDFYLSNQKASSSYISMGFAPSYFLLYTTQIYGNIKNKFFISFIYLMKEILFKNDFYLIF